MRVPFALVDVFADRPLTGNPLALVPDGDGLNVDRMRAIAREFNQSETTFLLASTRAGADRRLRSFTPIGAEVDGAGHNALGAWLWLVHAGQVGTEPRTLVTQEIGDDLLPVEIIQEPGQPARVIMDQSAPRIGAVIPDGAELAAALGLEEEALDPQLAARVVSTGVGHLLVALAARADVDRAAPDPARLREVLRRAGGEGCYVYSTAAGEQEDGLAAYARFFNPTVGISEDPATGTAAGPLGALLVRSGRTGPGRSGPRRTGPGRAGGVSEGTRLMIEQGRVLGRPSRIRVDVIGERVRISGSGIVVGEGSLTV